MRTFADELAELDRQGLRRALRTLHGWPSPNVAVGATAAEAEPVVNFSSNDYLGLAGHPFAATALAEAAGQCGAGSAASRLVCGTWAPHVALEQLLARLKGTGAALAFSSGYAASVGTVTSIVHEGDVVILDKLAHASLIDGAKLSGATLRVFRHNDLTQLEDRLRWAATAAKADGRVLVITESIFSMDGDRAPLREIASLCRKNGALLLVDEAHAFGVVGPQGLGLAHELGIAGQIDFHLGTLSKAVGLSGGYAAASADAVDWLINRARSFIYSTAPPPALAMAAARIVGEFIAAPPGDAARARLWKNVTLFTAALPESLLPASHREGAPSPIVPVVLGDESRAVQAASALRDRGFLVPAIRYPTVARGQSRLRVTLSAAHRPEQILALAAALKDVCVN